MMPPLKFYPDRRWPRALRLATDLAVLCGTVLWLLAAILVYNTVLALQAIAKAISDTGLTFQQWLTAFHNATPAGIPFLSDFLRQQADALRRVSGDQLVRAGSDIHDDVQRMAIVIALLVAIPPIVLVTVRYGGRRWREAREMGSALAFARAATRSGRLEQALGILAYRAVATLSFTDLMRISTDPVADLAAHRYEPLATALLRQAGLRPPPPGTAITVPE